MTKEEFENYYEVHDKFWDDISQRENEIEKICKEYHYNIGIRRIDKTFIERDDGLVYFGEHWSCMFEWLGL